jgi:ElaB/YqjD/DUF883 family membrane-anchored ribosome-binding protein
MPLSKTSKKVATAMEKQYGKKKGKEVFHATANKKGGKAEKASTWKNEETKASVIADNDVLTESQKVELKGIIDSLVEERVQDKMKEFVHNYTRTIAESAAKKMNEKLQNGLIKNLNEEIQTLRDKSERLCRTIVLEASEKVATAQRKQKKLLEDIRTQAPTMVEELAEEKAKTLAKEAQSVIEENKKYTSSMISILNGLKTAGYVINEDVERVIEKERAEKNLLRQSLVKTQRDLKVAQLTESMLPVQKKRIQELLEECMTAKQVEERFSMVKEKVFAEEFRSAPNTESKKPEAKELTEEQVFDQFLGVAKKLVK